MRYIRFSKIVNESIDACSYERTGRFLCRFKIRGKTDSCGIATASTPTKQLAIIERLSIMHALYR